MTNADDADAGAAARRVEEGCVVVVVVVFERWIDVAFVSFLSSRVVPSD